MCIYCVYLWTYTCVFLHACMYYMYVHAYIHKNMFIHIWFYTCGYMHTYACLICVFIDMHTQINASAYLPTYMCTICIHTYIHMYVCIHACKKCLYVHMSQGCGFSDDKFYYSCAEHFTSIHQQPKEN